jgi:hypothetical protein
MQSSSRRRSTHFRLEYLGETRAAELFLVPGKSARLERHVGQRRGVDVAAFVAAQPSFAKLEHPGIIKYREIRRMADGTAVAASDWVAASR